MSQYCAIRVRDLLTRSTGLAATQASTPTQEFAAATASFAARIFASIEGQVPSLLRLSLRTGDTNPRLGVNVRGSRLLTSGA